MRPTIPADVDALMWSVAESGDDQAMSEFGDRFPEYRSEMLKRIGMVRSLRGARPDATFASNPPRFKPTQEPASLGFARWAWVVAPILLAGIAFGSYNVAIRYMKPATVVVKQASDSEPFVDQNLPEPLPDNALPPDGTVENRVEPIDPNRTTHVAIYEKPISLKFDKISLHAAIDAIGQSSGLTIELAPGLEDIDISMKYSNMPAAKILHDMGANFGFSVFEQERGRVLIVPEVDPNKQAGETIAPTNPADETVVPTNPESGKTSGMTSRTGIK